MPVARDVIGGSGGGAFRGDKRIKPISHVVLPDKGESRSVVSLIHPSSADRFTTRSKNIKSWEQDHSFLPLKLLAGIIFPQLFSGRCHEAT